MPLKKRSGLERIFEARLYPTNRQIARFNEMLWICGSLWNAALSERVAEYRRYQRFGMRADYVVNWPTFKSQITQLNSLVEEHAWIREPVYYETLVAVLKQLDNAMKRFIGQKNKGIKVGFPRFKPAGTYNTLTVYHAMRCLTFSKEKQCFNLKSMKKLGGISYRSGKKRKKLPDMIANVKITRRSGKWYAYFQHEVDRDIRRQELEERNVMKRNNRSKSINILGADIGITQFLATSDGKIFSNPRFQKKYAEKTANIQREMERLRGPKNSKPTFEYKLVRASFTKLSSKVSRCRRDWHHKLSRNLVDAHTTFALEDLQLVNMTKSAKGTVEFPGSMVPQKSGLNRSILDVAPEQFREFLKSKVFEAGGQVILVDPKYTSQTCSRCDRVDKKSRVARGWFVCTQCGFEIDADVNASRNQRKRGLAVLRPSIRAA